MFSLLEDGHSRFPCAVKAKAMAAFLSGEMKDTVQMNPAGAYGGLLFL